MKQMTKGTLFFMVIGFFLIAAYAPAPVMKFALTESPSVTMTPTIPPAQQTADAAFETVMAEGSATVVAAAATNTALNQGPATATPVTPGPRVTATYPLFDPAAIIKLPTGCIITITKQDGSSQKYSLPTRIPTLSLTANQDRIKIIKPVVLRSGPSLSFRTLQILNSISDATYKIVGGPVYTDIRKEGRRESKSSYRVFGRYYKWWKIEIPDGTTGWVAEASACGQFYFIAPAPTSTPATTSTPTPIPTSAPTLTPTVQ